MLQINKEYYKAYKEELNQFTTGDADTWVRESSFDRDRIYQIVQENEPSEYDSVLMDSEEWWIHYHLNPLREALFNWYDFKETGTLLEIGAELGALTGLFSRRCAKVTVLEKSYRGAEIIAERYRDRNNISIYACEAEDLPEDFFAQQFDYIIVGKTLEEKGHGYWHPEMYSSYLKNIGRWLKPDGKILIKVNNRYGTKYFCGYRDAHTGVPFDGINKYPNGSRGYMLCKSELETVLKGAGIGDYKFFYPLPDAVFPQLIYSDEYQNKENISERLSFFDPAQDTRLVPEGSLYNDIMDNHVLYFMANAFLVECCGRENRSDISCSVISTDRLRERAFATNIYRNKLVRKKNLFPEGAQVLREAYQNIVELKERGIPVVPHEWHADGIQMPYFDGEGMTSVLQRMVREDTALFAALIDMWYNYILQSSEHCQSEEYAPDVFGPVLKKAYIDLVPANAFYRDGEIYFYDQEFVREKCPAKYVLFRGLKYTYMSMWDMESLYPIQTFKDKYDLNQVWDVFEEEERHFIGNLKADGRNSQLEKWKHVDIQVISKRGRLLDKENLELLDYQFTDNTKAIQQVELELLKEFQRVCEENGLTYYAFYGTLIGAVRHKGFIPWDDDIDVVMFREDYNKLLEIAKGAFSSRFFLQTCENDKECFYGNYAKLRANWTSAIELVNWEKDCNQGIALDIIPLDDCYGTESENRTLQQKILLYQRMLFAKNYESETKLHDMDEAEFGMYKRMAAVFSKEELMEKLNELFVSGNRECGMVTILSRYIFWKYIIYKKADFGKGKKIPFETIEINVPENCDKLLRGSIPNYMEYPDPEQRKAKHGNCLLSVKVSFEEYRRKFRNVFSDLDDKNIVLVGSGRTLEAYINTRADRFKPKLIVDIKTDTKGGNYNGYSIEPLEKLKEIPERQRKVIICADDFKQYEQALLNIGVWDYYIFAHTKWWLKITEDQSYE